MNNYNYNLKERSFDALNEKVIEFDHESGLHVCIIPKKGFKKKYACVTVDFGSLNTSYSENSKVFTVPEGTAHFLEHKLYEQPDCDVMSAFSALGASCNAMTGFSNTVYYFECMDNFKECFELLLKQVFHPYFTNENVEKEKGIIIQEINMYLDNPYYVSSMELLKLLYKNLPIRNDIAGTQESVNSITADILYDCHRAFYNPSNMCLSLVGDFDIGDIFEILEKSALPTKSKTSIIKLLPEEPSALAGKFSMSKMETATPIFDFGFKEEHSKYSGLDRVLRKTAGSIANDMFFGSSSKLYEELYNKGYINYSFQTAYELERDYGLFEIAGTSDKYLEVKEYIINYIEKLNKEGIDKLAFNRVKNAIQGQRIRIFDSISQLGRIFGKYYLDGMDGFDYFNACGKISEEDINDILGGLLSSEMAVSIIEGLA